MAFSISANIQDGGQKSEKAEFFRGPRGVVLSTLGFARNHSISYSFQDKLHFLFL